MPNGLSSAPRVFTKLMRSALSFLRKEHEVAVSGFLDDNLLVHYDDIRTAMMKGAVSAIQLQKLGFTINIPKSVADAGVTRISHLGFILDSICMRAFLSEKKTQKILKAIQDCLDKARITIRELASVKGKIEATRVANPYAQLFTKRLEIEKIDALNQAKFNYEARISLSQECRKDLEVVKSDLPGISAPLRIPPPDITLKSDSSGKGWGVFNPFTGERGGGHWSQEEKLEHINILELKACFFTLKCFCADRRSIHVRLMSDNRSAVASISKQGSTKKRLNQVARELWQYAKERDIWLSSAHIAGKLNVESDEESRIFDENIEWSLRDNLFQEITELFGQPSIDLFASRLNNKVNRYVSWKPDPEAEAIDSFKLHSWGNEFFWAFPPFCVISKVIQKIIQDEAEGILLVPDWVSQPWYNLVKRCTIEEPYRFTVKSNELFLPFSLEQVHPLVPLRMQALRVSGRLAAVNSLKK